MEALEANFERGPLCNDVVLRNLFSMMDVKLLKTCRQVCKIWRDTIDPIFKKRVKIYFNIKSRNLRRRENNIRSSPSLVEKLWSYESMIESHTSEIPFTAFKFEGAQISWNSLSMHAFFRAHGNEMKELAIELYGRPDPIIEFFECLLMIGKCAPGIEKLELKLLSDEVTSNMANIDFMKVLPYILMLKKLKWFSFTYRLIKATPNQIETLTGIISRMLSTSKSLTHYEINSPMTILTSKLLTKESYCSLKFLSIEHVWMYRRAETGIDESVFQLLLEYSKKGMQLEEIFVEIWFWVEDNSNLPKKFHFLMEFLRSQSKSLKKLTISVVCQCMKPLTWFFPQFPKMEKLQQLKIVYGDITGNYFMFEDKNLEKPFPLLESIHFYYKTIGDNNVIHSILNTFEMGGKLLTSVHIAKNVLNAPRFHLPNSLMTSCVRHYGQAKFKIPYLKSFTISDMSSDIPRIACYNGNPEDSFSSFDRGESQRYQNRKRKQSVSFKRIFTYI